MMDINTAVDGANSIGTLGNDNLWWLAVVFILLFFWYFQHTIQKYEEKNDELLNRLLDGHDSNTVHINSLQSEIDTIKASKKECMDALNRTIARLEECTKQVWGDKNENK